jgi:hypothetical protein
MLEADSFINDLLAALVMAAESQQLFMLNKDFVVNPFLLSMLDADLLLTMCLVHLLQDLTSFTFVL